jgi:hypothetical protein
MSRLNELKKQYPELNLTFFDLMVRFDTSKTYKYIPLLCKIFSQKFNVKKIYFNEEYPKVILEIQSTLINRGISTDGLNDSQLYFMSTFLSEHFNPETFSTLKLFMEYMDKGFVNNNDVTSYKTIDDVRGAVTLASIKEISKELESQVIKEYEDDVWTIVRPLTFAASAKYGASTKWCTTYQKEKQYFERYWRRGILVYFINKQTGYKFAGYKATDGDSEFSFWNAEDIKVDYLDIDAEDYLFPIVRKIFKSKDSNKNLCSIEIQEQVHKECLNQMKFKSTYSVIENNLNGQYEQMNELMDEQPMPDEPTEVPNYLVSVDIARRIMDIDNSERHQIAERDYYMEAGRPTDPQIPRGNP